MGRRLAGELILRCISKKAMEKLYYKLNLSLELEQNKHIRKTTEKIRADYVE